MLKGDSIDPNEVDYYTNLAHTWWDTSGPFWPLHTLNQVRIEWILSQLQQPLQLPHTNQPLLGLNVLDIGCGGGILSESLAKLGATVTGIDVTEKNITVAKIHAEKNNLDIDYRYQTVETLAASEERFDIVFNMEVVEHVTDVSNFMAACCTLVEPNGFQFVATINRNWLAYLIAIFGAESVLKLLPKGTHHYQKLRKPKEITAWLLEGGLVTCHSTGVAVNPLTRTMKTHAREWVNYMLFAQKQASVPLP